MKKLIFIFVFIGSFQSQTNAFDYYSFNPNPIREGQIVSFGIFFMCGQEYSNPNLNKVGTQVNLQVSYHNFGCPIGVPTPEGYEYFELGAFTAGDYQLNLTIVNKDDLTVIHQETFPFGVLPIQQVPLSSNLMYLLLGSLLLISGGLFQRYRSHKQ